MVELDETVRQNQLAFQPFARSGRVEAELLGRHPYLISELEQARKRKIDSMQLRSRLHEDEERSASLSKFRLGSWDKSIHSPTNPRPGRSSPKPSSSTATSPALLPTDTSSDMLFDMDEERIGDTFNENLPLRATPQPHNAHGIGSPVFEVGSWFNARGKPLSASLSTEASSVTGSYVQPHQYSVSPTVSQTPKTHSERGGATNSTRPWQTTTPASKKIDLKDIMAEASAERTSSLSIVTDAKTSSIVKPSKMSQRDRKKMMQMQSQNQGDTTAQSNTSASALEANQPGPVSPWHVRPSLPLEPKGLRQPAPQLPARPSSKPGMTMRQTIAGTTPPPKPKAKAPSRSNLASTAPVAGTTASPQIQSIRHTPRPPPATSAGPSSMADIMLRAESEKSAAKEAVAKQSLLEIQQAQEFEKWFNEESKRVQAASTAANTKDSRGKRGRGRGGSKRGGRRGSSSDAIDPHIGDSHGRGGGGTKVPVSGRREQSSG